MDRLQEIIHTFQEEEYKDFAYFVQRFRRRQSRKDLELFQLLRQDKEWTTMSIMQALYGRSNKMAYYATRKRLYKQVYDYLSIQNKERDDTDTAATLNLIALSLYLLDHGRPKLAWYYLKQAENQAAGSEGYSLLNGILLLQIDHYGPYAHQALSQIIAKYEANKKKVIQEEKLTIIYSEIKANMEQWKLQTHIDYQDLITQLFKKYGLEQEILLHPRIIYKLIQIMRSAIIAKKEYYQFEPFIITKYKKLCANNVFTPKNIYYQFSIQFLIAHTLYRNKKFDQSLAYVADIEAGVAHSTALTKQFRVRLCQLQSICLAYTNKLPQAIAKIEELMQSKTKFEPKENLQLLTQLGIFYFQQQEYKKANQTLRKIYHSDQWCERIMGTEWVFKKNLMEIILYYDQGKVDLSEARMRAVERKFRDFLADARYTRVKTFLMAIKKVMQDPFYAQTDEFEQQIEHAFEWIPMAEEDLQAVGFYAWLKSKMQQRKYYQVLLELVRQI